MLATRDLKWSIWWRSLTLPWRIFRCSPLLNSSSKFAREKLKNSLTDNSKILIDTRYLNSKMSTHTSLAILNSFTSSKCANSWGVRLKSWSSSSSATVRMKRKSLCEMDTTQMLAHKTRKRLLTTNFHRFFQSIHSPIIRLADLILIAEKERELMDLAEELNQFWFKKDERLLVRLNMELQVLSAEEPAIIDPTASRSLLRIQWLRDTNTYLCSGGIHLTTSPNSWGRTEKW